MVRSADNIAGIRAFIQRRGDYLISNHAAEKVRALTVALKDVNEKILLEEKISRESGPSSLDVESSLEAVKGSGAILLVEDDDDTQKLITRILESVPYDVTIAGDGIEALTCLEQKDFDLILSDINMPNLDGFKLTEMINQKGIVAPIIFLTGSPDEQDEIRAFELGALDFIRKPIRKELFLSRVRNVLNKREKKRQI